MLNGEGCQELDWLHDLVGSNDALVLEEVPEDMHKLAGWKPHGLPKDLHSLEEACAETISDCY
jgi:hypothetical protein